MVRIKAQRMVPMSVKTNDRLRKHMLATGKSNLTTTVDSIVNDYLDSPAAQQLEDANARIRRLVSENLTLRASQPKPAFANPFAR